MAAVNGQSKFVYVCAQDDDLAELRERREWMDALVEMKGSMSREAKIGLRAEAKVCVCVRACVCVCVCARVCVCVCVCHMLEVR